MKPKNKKSTWKEKILYYEVCSKGKMSGIFHRAYRLFLYTTSVLMIVLFVVYVYLFVYARETLKENYLFKPVTMLSKDWTWDENIWQALIIDQKFDENILYLQVSGLDATLMVKYDNNSKIYNLEYQPALVNNGKIIHASRIYTVPVNRDRLCPGMIIYLRNIKDLDSGLYAPEILVSNYDELTIPNLEF